jgi:hypothetical protein
MRPAVKSLSGLLGLWMFLSPAAHAETVYVTDKLTVGLQAEPVAGGAAAKTVESGAPLEVLERADRFARVRDKQGAEGWIEARFLSHEPPARVQSERLQTELRAARAQLAETQKRLKSAEARLAQESAKVGDLTKKLEEKPESPTPREQNVPPAATGEQPPTAAVAAPPEGETGGFSFLWLVLSFAMLGVGFAAGVIWLRERNRKRLGGMYLRI